MIIFGFVIVFVIGLGIGMVVDEIKDKHKWGDWETIDDHELKSDDDKYLGRVTVQRRVCSKTGEVEQNTLEAGVQEAMDWGKWKTVEEGKIAQGKDKKATIGNYKVLKRTCKRTGKEEWDKLEWTLGQRS